MAESMIVYFCLAALENGQSCRLTGCAEFGQFWEKIPSTDTNQELDSPSFPWLRQTMTNFHLVTS